MRKVEVLADRLGVTVHKGSIINVSDRQYELIKGYVKDLDEVETAVLPVEEIAETPEAPKKRSRKAKRPIG